MDPKKLEAIKNWETPWLAADIQAFLGFANFYRRFIANFLNLTRPLNNHIKGEAFTTHSRKKKIRYVPFIWTLEYQQVFNSIKEAFHSAPILAYFDPKKET
jgi:hypothetical protein